MPRERSRSFAVDLLGARTSPSPGRADPVTPRASQKPPTRPRCSHLRPKPSLVPSSRSCSDFQWLFSSRPEPPAGGLSPRLVQTQPGAARGSDAFPGSAVLCPRSRRTTASVITSEGQKSLFIARIPSGPAKPAWLGRARPPGTAAGSQPPRSCLSLSALEDHNVVLQHPGLPQIQQNDVTCLARDRRGREPPGTAQPRGAATPSAPAPGGRRRRRRRRVQGR